MKISEILKKEESNTQNILLYKNGGYFCHAYNRSAYAFCSRIRELKVTPKELKSEHIDYVFVGFPVNKLEEYMAGSKGYYVMSSDGDPVEIMLQEPIDESAYLDWRRSFFQNNAQVTEDSSLSTVESNALPAESGDVIMLRQAARDILDLDMSSLTPMDSFMFLHGLRKRLKDYNPAGR